MSSAPRAGVYAEHRLGEIDAAPVDEVARLREGRWNAWGLWRAWTAGRDGRLLRTALDPQLLHDLALGAGFRLPEPTADALSYADAIRTVRAGTREHSRALDLAIDPAEIEGAADAAAETASGSPWCATCSTPASLGRSLRRSSSNAD